LGGGRGVGRKARMESKVKALENWVNSPLRKVKGGGK